MLGKVLCDVRHQMVAEIRPIPRLLSGSVFSGWVDRMLFKRNEVLRVLK
jgi:hypothetical protein